MSELQTELTQLTPAVHGPATIEGIAMLIEKVNKISVTDSTREAVTSLRTSATTQLVQHADPVLTAYRTAVHRCKLACW